MKNETETTSLWRNSIITGATVAAMLTPLIVPRHHVSGENSLSHRLVEETTSSQLANIQLPQPINRATLIRSIRGKYSFVQTSSDEFAKRKQREINLEG